MPFSLSLIWAQSNQSPVMNKLLLWEVGASLQTLLVLFVRICTLNMIKSSACALKANRVIAPNNNRLLDGANHYKLAR